MSTPVETSTPTPTATAAPTSTRVTGPRPEDLKATAVAGLPETPTPESGDVATWGDIEVFPLDTGDEGTSLWVVYSVGMGFYDPDAGHFVAIYTYEGDWRELDRVVLTGCAEYVNSDSLVQVQVEPSHFWLELDTNAGAHTGCYDLFSFDGENLRLEASSSNSSPGAGNLFDVDGDGILEAILNETENYIFCYACGVRRPDFRVMRWNGEQMVEADLEPLPGTAPDEMDRLNDRALELAHGELWQDAREVIGRAAAIDVEDPDVRDTVVWNYLLIDMMAKAQAEEAEFSAYPLLNHIFAGDYASALDVLRAYDAEEIWGPETPLVVDTVAEGWETALSGWITSTTNLALSVEPELAPAYFLRGWAVHLHNPSDANALADVEKATLLDPDEPLFAESLAYLEEFGPPATPTARPGVATRAPSPTPKPTSRPAVTATPTPTPTSLADWQWQVRSLLVGPGQPGRLYALLTDDASLGWASEFARLLISDDDGQTWVPFPGGRPPGECVWNVNMDYATPDALYASTCEGLYRWSGEEWQFVSDEDTAVVAVVYGQPHILWATTTFAAGAGVIRSEDGGASWQQAGYDMVSFNGVANLGIDPGDANTLYAIIWPKYAGTYLRRGTSPGQWEMMPTPLNNGTIGTGMTIDGATGALYVVVWNWQDEHYELWRTVDPKVPNVGDVQWEFVHDFGGDVMVELLASGWSPQGLALYANVWSVKKLDDSQAEIGDPIVYRSPDGGQSWAPLPIPLSVGG